MTERDREVEKHYSNAENVRKLERLVESLRAGKAFEIQVAGERIYVPAHAAFSIEHERDGREEELEFQLRWSNDP